jgi:hypothetical protein
MEPICSLQSSQDRATGPYLEPDASITRLPTHFPKNNSDILPSMPSTSEWSLPFSFPTQQRHLSTHFVMYPSLCNEGFSTL